MPGSPYSSSQSSNLKTKPLEREDLDLGSLVEDLPEDAVLVEKKAPKREVRWGELSLGLFSLLILGMPLFFGGAQDSVLLAVRMLIALTVGLTVLQALRLGQERVSLTLGPLSRDIIVAGAVFSAFVLLQLLPLPVGLLGISSGLRGEAFASVGASWGQFSLDPESSLTSFAWYGSLFLLAGALLAAPYTQTRSIIRAATKRRVEETNFLLDRARTIDAVADRIQLMLILGGLLASLVAIAHWGLGEQDLFGLFNRENNISLTKRARWPFVNPDHLTAFINISIIMCAGRLMRLLQLAELDRSTNSARPSIFSRRRWSQPSMVGPKAVLAGSLLVMLLANFLAVSRAGVVLALGGILVLVFWFERLRPDPPRKIAHIRGERSSTFVNRLELFLLRAGAPIVLVVMLLGAMLLLGEAGRAQLASRVEYGLAVGYDDLRLLLSSLTLSMFASFPLFGVGFGCWQHVAPMFATEGLAGFFLDFAHNEPLQLLAEVGVFGMLPVVFLLTSLFLAVRRVWSKSLMPVQRFSLVCGLVACAIPVVHSFVDFIFHLPAIALAYVGALVYLSRLIDAADTAESS